MTAPTNKETKQDKPEIRVPKNKNSEYVRERLRIFNENEALLKAKTNARNRARILLPRALRVIAMEIEGFAREVPTNRQLFKEVKNKIDLEMENYLTQEEKRRRIKIKSFFDIFYRLNLFAAVVLFTYSIFVFLLDVQF